jgi:Pectate lyase superfamily protein
VSYTIPPDTRANLQTGHIADHNNIADVLTGMGAVNNVLNTAYSGGADKTGAADSTAAIRAAFSALPAAGGVVYLPTGTYKTNGPLVMPSGSALVGDHGNILSQTNYGTTIKPSASWVQGGASSNAVILIESGTEQQVRNLMIDGTALAVSADGIQVNGSATNVKLSDLEIRHPTGCGLNGITVSGNTVRAEHVTVTDAGNVGFLMMWTDSTFIDCEAITSTAQGWYIGPNGINSQLIGCRAEWSGTNGFQISGSWGTGAGAGGLLMTGCSTDRNAQDGVNITATGTSPILITGMMCRRDGSGSTSAGRAGVHIDAATCPVIIDGLTVYPGVDDAGTGNNTPQYGVSITGSVTHAAVTNAFLHAASAGTNGTITSSRAIATRTGTTSSPSAITLVADSS